MVNSLAICCMISNADSDTELIVVNKTHRGYSGHRHSMPCRLEGSMLNNQRMSHQIYLLTVYDHSHIMDETIDNFKRLRCCCPSLVLSESVQPLKNRLDFILSEKLLYKFFCLLLSLRNIPVKTDLLGRPCLICFVASARVESSSTMIFTTISVIAGIGGTLVYMSRRFKKRSMDSSRSTRESKSSLTPLNA